MKQATLAAAADQGAEFERFRRPTRRDVFLQTMDTIVPWAELCEVIEPHYPKAGRGRPPIGLERMLRMYFVQHWFNLADEACEEALLDSTALRRFVGIDLGRERVPDGTTLLKFRRLLEDDKHKLGAALFTKVGEVLQSKGMKVGTGTIVDATIISAPSSTKNDKGERDPEMHQTKKGQQYFFGMKLHIGVDSETGLAHSAVVTAANVHDKHPLPELLHGQELEVFGDSAYASQQALIAAKAPKAKDQTNQRVRGTGYLADLERIVNRIKSKTRSRVEHVFAVVKRQFGFSKVRYKGLAKNATRAFVALGLANIYLARKRLVLIDTAGLPANDPALRMQLEALSSLSLNVKNYLVLAATSQSQVLKSAWQNYRSCGLAGCILTKLDEAGSLGEALALAISQHLPVAYLADGPKIPDDLHVARAHQLVSRAVSLQSPEEPSEDAMADMFAGLYQQPVRRAS